MDGWNSTQEFIALPIPLADPLSLYYKLLARPKTLTAVLFPRALVTESLQARRVWWQSMVTETHGKEAC